MLSDDLKLLFLWSYWEKILEEKSVNLVCKYSFSLSSFVLIWILLIFCMEHALSIDVFLKSSSTCLKCFLKVHWWFVKIGLSPSKKDCVVCLIESPLRMTKNVFYFVLKAFFVLKIFTFLSRRFAYVGKTAWLER